MIVLFAWVAAVVVALGLLAVVGFELFGHVRRLRAAMAQASGELVPLVQRLAARLRDPAPAGSPEAAAAGKAQEAGRHHAAP